MEVLQYQQKNDNDIMKVYNQSGVKQGYAKADESKFRKLVLNHPDFQGEHVFVLWQEGKVQGFVCGCTRDRVRGYFTCLMIFPEYDTKENTILLLDALEESFRKKGCSSVMSTFFNPMRLPWVIPGTDGHQHNNAPGIFMDSKLYGYMQEWGYSERAKECAMHLELKDFRVPDWIEDQKKKALENGYSVDWYDKEKHRDLVSMVSSMGNEQWSEEIPRAAETINMLVALKGDVVVGFTGPVYPEETGRGYFAGIAVSGQHEKQGLGTLLFYALCQAEKEAGAKYMSLFTSSDNHAQKIYLNAGFSVKRIFAIMEKKL